MKMLLLLLLVCNSLYSQDRDPLQELTERIEELERQQEELIIQSHGRGNKVNSFLQDNLTIGGFVESGILGFEGPDTDLQVMNTSNLLGLNIAADFSPRLHLVTQTITFLSYSFQNQHNNPQAIPDQREFKEMSFTAVLAQGYLEYTFSRQLRLQAGLGYVPFGSAYQQRDFILFWRRRGPQILRTTHLLTPLWHGLHLLGQFPRHNGGEWGYNLYTANPIDPSQNRVMGGGGRIWMSSSNERIIGGLSGFMAKFGSGTDETVGADLRVRENTFQLMTEYARHVTESDDPWSAYLETGIFVKDETILLFGFGDYAESPLSSVTLGQNKIPDDYKKWEYGIGVNWLPTSYTRFRMTLTQHEYVGENATVQGQDRDYHSVDFSVGVAF